MKRHDLKYEKDFSNSIRSSGDEYIQIDKQISIAYSRF